MKAVFERYRLTTYERRFAVFAGLLVLFVVHVTLVHPHLGEWSVIRGEIGKLENDLTRFRDQIGKRTQFESTLQDLEESDANRIDAAHKILRLMQERIGAIGEETGFPTGSFQAPRIRNNEDDLLETYQMREFEITPERSVDIRSLLGFLFALSRDDWTITVHFLSIDKRRATEPDRIMVRISLTAYFQVKPSTVADVE